jgi:hypothetical protein
MCMVGIVEEMASIQLVEGRGHAIGWLQGCERAGGGGGGIAYQVIDAMQHNLGWLLGRGERV